jgi:tetratricopeptide (TPR) repeat protein
MMRRAPILATIVGLSFLLGAPTAEGQNKPAAQASAGASKKAGKPTQKQLAEAKRLFEQGAELYGKGSYEQAIEAWEQSYELSKKDLILESIANAYERLGQAEKAREYLARWRDAAPSEESADLDARIKNLDDRIARDKAEKDKAEKAERDAREKREAEERAAREKPATDGGGMFIPGLLMAGLGGGLAITGGVLDIVAGSRRPDEATVCGTVGDKQLCRASARSDIEASNRLAIAGDVLLFGGVAVAAVGVVLVVTQSGGKKDEAGAKAAVAPLFVPGGGGVSVVGRF